MLLKILRDAFSRVWEIYFLQYTGYAKYFTRYCSRMHTTFILLYVSNATHNIDYATIETPDQLIASTHQPGTISRP